MELEDMRRVKILQIPGTVLFGLLTRKEIGIGTFIKNVPNGTTIISINGEWRAKTVELLIYHPSFEIISEGCTPPYERVELEDIEFQKVVPTCKLVAELTTREGVDELTAGPNQFWEVKMEIDKENPVADYQNGTGPARILVVID